MAEWLRAIFASAIAPVAFLLPGWLLSRRSGSPSSLLTGFLGSCALWFHLVLGCTLAGVHLDRFTLSGGWLAVCIGTYLVTRKKSPVVDSPPTLAVRPQGLEWIWVASAGLGLAALAARAVIDPLSGWDNGFRWDYLGREMLARGELNFYPPVTAGDFETYAWCDGIPPLIPSLNAFLYLVTGVHAPSITAIRVVAEAGLIGLVAFRVGRDTWGVRGGWPAVGLLGTSSLLLWGIAIGQETGLLAVSLVALVWLLERARRDPKQNNVGWAAVAAGIGALSRDYGLVFGLLGFCALLVQPALRRSSVRFAAIFALLVFPWYARNAWRTGNPIFPHSLGGFLPTNPVFAEFLRAVKGYWQLGSTHVSFPVVGMVLATTMGLVFFAGVIGATRQRRAALLTTFAALVVFALWYWSVAETAGGVKYSLRVLTPAIALLAGLGGWLGDVRSTGVRVGSAILALVLSVDAARRTWLMPVEPLAAAWPMSWQSWRSTRDFFRASKDQPAWDNVVQLAQGRLVVTDSPEMHASLLRRGGRATLFFSPAVTACFNDRLPFDEIVRQMKSADVKLITLLADDPVSNSFVDAHVFLRTLRHQYLPALRIGDTSVYDLDALARRP